VQVDAVLQSKSLGHSTLKLNSTVERRRSEAARRFGVAGLRDQAQLVRGEVADRVGRDDEQGVVERLVREVDPDQRALRAGRHLRIGPGLDDAHRGAHAARDLDVGYGQAGRWPEEADAEEELAPGLEGGADELPVVHHLDEVDPVQALGQDRTALLVAADVGSHGLQIPPVI